MRHILIQHPPHLPKRWPKSYAGRVAGLALLGSHDEISLFLKKKASWNILKKWLSNASNEKCWYCETKSARAPFDVDHFRPKLGVTVDRQRLGAHTGYYWLAYEWWNFRLSCQRCNRPEKDENGVLRGKANEFPVHDEANRSLAAADPLDIEAPRLLDPCVEDDCKLLAHYSSGEVNPSGADGTWEFERGRYTIDILGLNEHHAPENRRKSWQQLSLLIQLHETSQSNAIRDVVRDHLSEEQEYASFFRASIATYRDKPWVAALI